MTLWRRCTPWRRPCSRSRRSCVGLSIALFEHDLTFTLAASSLDLAALDGVQYLDGGPCVTSAHEARDTESNASTSWTSPRWRLFAQSSAAAGP